MRDVITFWQKEIKEKPLEQFYFAVQKPTFIPAWWSCFGWGYSPRQKLQFALLCFSEALVLSWLSELQHILLMGTSPNTTCTHLFTVQQSSQFHFSRKKKSLLVYLRYLHQPNFLFAPDASCSSEHFHGICSDNPDLTSHRCTFYIIIY